VDGLKGISRSSLTGQSPLPIGGKYYPSAYDNEAVHDVDFVASREDAKDTIEFTEALIAYVFTYRHKFDEFKKRRAKAASAPKVKMLDAPKDL
jgi:hypothetical protein